MSWPRMTKFAAIKKVGAMMVVVILEGIISGGWLGGGLNRLDDIWVEVMGRLR